MHFDQRTQRALRDAGLTTDEIREVSEAVVEATREEADALEAFFETWGAYVEDGRVLSDEVAELTLGPTVHDRVRFAGTRDAL